MDTEHLTTIERYRLIEAGKLAPDGREPERMAAPGEPAWKCGHPRTPENTKPGYGGRSAQCAECHRQARRRAELHMNQLGAGARKAWRQWRYNSRLRMERNEKRLAEQNAEIAARAKRYGTEDYLGGLAAAERAGPPRTR